MCQSRSEDPLQLEVRRGHIFRDALQAIRFSQDDLYSPLQLTLTGEERVDLGGVRREFWSLFLDQATMSSLFTGLQKHQVLDVLWRNKDGAFLLLSGRKKPVTAAAVRELLDFKYRGGNQCFKDEETAQSVRIFLQATKRSDATVNGYTLKPEDVLMWLTGARAIPAIGFHKKVEVFFGEATMVNTCVLIVTLGPHPPAVEDIVQYYTELVINSNTVKLDYKELG